MPVATVPPQPTTMIPPPQPAQEMPPVVATLPPPPVPVSTEPAMPPPAMNQQVPAGPSVMPTATQPTIQEMPSVGPTSPPPTVLPPGAETTQTIPPIANAPSQVSTGPAVSDMNAQKSADEQAQNAQMRNQVSELNNRLASMEVAFHQLTKILQGMRQPAPAMVSAPAEVIIPEPVRSAAPHVRYTVQAIIPGRAWLKSESGDTVTVAEGDTLREYGRVTKIDPYDGVVDIDVGGKIVSLSYGVSGD